MHQGIIYRIMKTEILRAGYPNALKHAVDVLQHGGLVAFPTDTVYGLAALPYNDEYVEGLFSAKGRNNTRAIGILIGDYEDLDKIVEHFDEIAERLAHWFWPGPLTLVVKKRPSLPKVLSPDNTIGIRMPAGTGSFTQNWAPSGDFCEYIRTSEYQHSGGSHRAIEWQGAFNPGWWTEFWRCPFHSSRLYSTILRDLA